MALNDLVLRAAAGLPTERTPVWLMRQAGRILPEYRAVREQAGSFINLVQNPEAACEVTLQPVRLLEADAAILFSDILVIPEAMGLPYTMVESKGPHFEKTIRTEADLATLRTANPEEHLGYVMRAIDLIKHELNGKVPLIGFAGAPWTIFCYMTEGRGSKDFSTSRKLLYQNPALAHDLLSRITASTISYLKAQIHHGADMVQIFDSWAGVLSPKLFRAFSLPYLERICQEVNEVPLTVFAKGAWFAAKELADLPCRTIGLDWQMDPAHMRSLCGDKTLQGNLDPAVLYASPADIRNETLKMLTAFGPGRHIANLGHGVYPDTNPDHVKVFVETVKSFNHQTQ